MKRPACRPELPVGVRARRSYNRRRPFLINAQRDAMSFLHPVLLGLLALAAIPVILHFLMRPKPKRFIFPALRLIEMRRKTNVRRLRLRHVWLLLLRIAVVAL